MHIVYAQVESSQGMGLTQKALLCAAINLLVNTAHTPEVGQTGFLSSSLESVCVDVNIYTVDVNTSRTPEEGAHSPSWPNRLIFIIIIILVQPKRLHERRHNQLMQCNGETSS